MTVLFTRAIAPAGASTGAGEAIDLRDGGAYLDGWGVSRAVDNVNGEIREILLGRDISEQTKLDNELIALDGTENKGRLRWQCHGHCLHGYTQSGSGK